ncbi:MULTISPECIES: MarR family transcriptional regulator [unclassified Streptomyces]|uniref:GbsR/MarR family transcriptional regulator n=1 Tax=unclassified Streptomyces TaxID=2593676 RepID=UPI00336A116E
MTEVTRQESPRDGVGVDFERDDDAVSQFVERFAADMTEAGMQRMGARVFAALLSSDSGKLSAAELAELLQISPAAVSGAVRYLAQVNLITREREPGSRRDQYRLYNEVWYEAVSNRDQILERWQHTMRDGAKILGPHTPAGARAIRTAEFYEFMQAELTAMLARWRARPESGHREGVPAQERGAGERESGAP